MVSSRRSDFNGGGKAWRQAGDRLPKRAIVLIGIALVAGLLGAGPLLRLTLSGANPPPGPKNAAIVDQLSLTQPNPGFVGAATDLLEQAGYDVHYFPGEQVTVDFYRNLPALGYDLIVLRVHSAATQEIDRETGSRNDAEYVSLFTGEPYREMKYPDDQSTGRVGKALYHKGAPPLFGITPDFVETSMRGRFDGALIIMMGCDGLRFRQTGQAFMDRGAKAFVSWSSLVSPSHTDLATQRLLQKLLVEELPVREAFAETATEIGPDPFYGGTLRALIRGE
jgi:hypothetical protein